MRVTASWVDRMASSTSHNWGRDAVRERFSPDACLGGRPPRRHRGPAADAGRASGPRARAGAGARPRLGLRCLPHRPAPGPGSGTGPSRFAVGQRIGAAWLAYTAMTCRFCMRGAENLCLNPRFTGWDQDGGYAEYLLVHEHYAYALPDSFADEQAAPLLCAGIIGYRALRQAALPHGGRLGIFGFGGSAHLVAQVAVAEGAEVHVFTRSA